MLKSEFFVVNFEVHDGYISWREKRARRFMLFFLNFVTFRIRMIEEALAVSIIIIFVLWIGSFLTDHQF